MWRNHAYNVLECEETLHTKLQCLEMWRNHTCNVLKCEETVHTMSWNVKEPCIQNYKVLKCEGTMHTVSWNVKEPCIQCPEMWRNHVLCNNNDTLVTVVCGIAVLVALAIIVNFQYAWIKLLFLDLVLMILCRGSCDTMGHVGPEVSSCCARCKSFYCCSREVIWLSVLYFYPLN